MVKRSSRMVWFLAALTSLLFWNCPAAKKNVKKNKPAAVVIAASGGCIRGRVVTDEDKGFRGVEVQTEPETKFEVTDGEGFFEICHKRERTDKVTGATRKVVIPAGDYSLKLIKEGFHANPVTFKYANQQVSLGKIRMITKSRPLPSVSETKEKEEKKTSGTSAPPPKSE